MIKNLEQISKYHGTDVDILWVDMKSEINFKPVKPLAVPCFPQLREANMDLYYQTKIIFPIIDKLKKQEEFELYINIIIDNKIVYTYTTFDTFSLVNPNYDITKIHENSGIWKYPKQCNNDTIAIDIHKGKFNWSVFKEGSMIPSLLFPPKCERILIEINLVYKPLFIDIISKNSKRYRKKKEIIHICRNPLCKKRESPIDRYKICNKCLCDNVRYCSKKCQKDDWERHKSECQAMPEI